MSIVPELLRHLEAARAGYTRLAETDQVRRGEWTHWRDTLAQAVADLTSGSDGLDRGRETATGHPQAGRPDDGVAMAAPPRGENLWRGDPATRRKSDWDLDDLSDLPAALVDKLRLRAPVPLGQTIRAVLADAGRPLRTKQIIVACIRRLGEGVPADKIARKLTRMAAAKGPGRLISTPGTPGCYALPEWGDAASPGP